VAEGSFERIVLKSGEPRADYIRRRLQEGAEPALIVKEINDPALFTGLPGKPWAAQVVYTEKRKLAPKAKTDFPEIPFKPAALAAPPTATDGGDPGSESSPPRAEVPAEFEGILSPEDVADIRQQAQEQVTAAQRKKAREALLAKARADLEREAREAAKRGVAKGDYVDVTIDLAPYAAYVSLDGERFYHGQTYRVARPVFAVLREQMQRSYAHQDSISGQKNDFNRQRMIAVSPKGITGAEGLRA